MNTGLWSNMTNSYSQYYITGDVLNILNILSSSSKNCIKSGLGEERFLKHFQQCSKHQQALLSATYNCVSNM